VSEIDFWHYAAREPGRVAVIDPEERIWSRGDLLAECNRIAHALREVGMRQGDVVAALLPNCREYLALALATHQIGLYLVPINWHLAVPEIEYILCDSRAKTFIAHARHASTALMALASSSHRPDHKVSIGAIDGFTDYREWISQRPDRLPGGRIGGALLNYTSGTTGKPKGVYRRLSQDIPPERVFAATVRMAREVCGIEPENDNVHCLCSPLYHTAPMLWSLAALTLGHVVLMMDKWEPQRMLELIEKYRVTTTHMVPTQFTRLLKVPADVRARYDVSSLRHVVHAAAPCPPAVKHAMLDWWGPKLHEYYGATEGGGTYVSPADWMRFPGTVGKSTPGMEVRILDESEAVLPAGAVGNVYMRRTPDFDFEYKGDPEKTRRARHGDFFTVGDVGYLNDEGYLFLCDRKIDMIVSGGANIYPAEIESALILHPSVADCAVFGVPNDEWGEEVRAVVQPAVGVQTGEELTVELMRFLGERIARMKMPRVIDYVSQLPRDANGKLYKRRLRDAYWDGHQRRI
jgi:long-chain acyl-CoA synthetase